MYSKGIINSDEFVKPLTRKEIASYLVEINKKISVLNNTEREVLGWFTSEYYYEINFLNKVPVNKYSGFLSKDEGDRWRFLFYSDSLFTLYFNPLLNFSAGSQYSEFQYRRTWGFNSYGYINNSFGFRINFEENYQFAKKYLSPYYLSDETGYIISHTYKDGFDYSETNGEVTYQNSWMTLSAVKQHFNAGSGNESQLVLSSRAPSFASVYFKLNPLPWFKFYYMHAWLLSGLVDSSRSYYIPDFNNRYRSVESDKYYVMHAIQVTPWDNLSVTLGESIIYSDRNVYMGYFIPFLFFRSVDHMFTYGKGDSGNNGSFFFDVKYRPVNNLALYGSIFLDEFSLTGFLKGSQFNNQSAFTIGGSYYTNIGDFNLNTVLEYTRIQPWVYSNWIPTQTYDNHFYSLGHYIGQNADELTLKLSSFFSARLKGGVTLNYIRKGGFASESDQYLPAYQSFLYGSVMKELRISPAVSYNFYHSLSAGLSYTYTNISDADLNRSPDFILGSRHSFALSVAYGF